jgi:hypothetical protein
MIVFGLFIAVLSAEISGCFKTSVNGSDFKLPPRRQNGDEVTSPHSKVLTRGKMFAPAIPTPQSSWPDTRRARWGLHRVSSSRS